MGKSMKRPNQMTAEEVIKQVEKYREKQSKLMLPYDLQKYQAYDLKIYHLMHDYISQLHPATRIL